MIGPLRSAFRRLPRPARRALAVVVALVVLSVVASALRPASRPAHLKRSAPRGATSTVRTSRGAQQHPAVVTPAQLERARTAAVRFLEGYLRLVYGRGSAGSVAGATPALRRRLARETALVTPVERRRHPRVVAFEAVGRAPGVVVASALVADGGVTTYAVRITLRESRSGWLVTGVDGG
jgi:hypothetical protein